MHKRERFYIPAHGPDENAVSSIFIKAVQLSRILPAAKRIVFLSNGLNNTQWLEKLFNYDAIRKLKIGVKIHDTTVTGVFDSIKSYRPASGDIVIAFPLNSEELLKLEDEHDIIALLAIPWTNDRIEKWTRITNSINILDNIPAVSYDEPPCVVIKALLDLTTSINMSTGLGHPSDEEEAKTYIRALHGRYKLDALEIESYLIKNMNWPKEFADELLEIINKINSGKAFHGGSKTGHKYHIDRWKNDCEE